MLLQVACILLPLCFLYDIFWVFLQPLLTHSDSVMVDVSFPSHCTPQGFLFNLSVVICSDDLPGADGVCNGSCCAFLL